VTGDDDGSRAVRSRRGGGGAAEFLRLRRCDAVGAGLCDVRLCSQGGGGGPSRSVRVPYQSVYRLCACVLRTTREKLFFIVVNISMVFHTRWDDNDEPHTR